MLETKPYDALLLVSFGGPEKPDDVVPFLRNVTAGKDIPDERLEEVGEHYFELRRTQPDQRPEPGAGRRDRGRPRRPTASTCPSTGATATGTPYLRDALEQMRRTASPARPSSSPAPTPPTAAAASTARTSPPPSAEVPGAPRIDRLRHYFNHPGFIEPMVDATLAALAELPEDARRGGHLAFVTHSIPIAMNDGSGPRGGAYVAQHRVVAAEIVERVREETGHRYPSELVFCSRSGPPARPVAGARRQRPPPVAAERGVPGVVVVPIGFVSDHMEVVYDLDTEARATAEEIGPAVRAGGDGRASTRGSWRWCATSSWSAGRRAWRVARAGRGRAPTRCGTCARPAAAPTRAVRRPALCGED